MSQPATYALKTDYVTTMRMIAFKLRLPSALAVGLALLLAAGGCGSEPNSDQAAPRHIDVDTAAGFTQTLVFVDASESARISDYTQQVFRDSLRGIVKADLDEPGDRLALYPVHEETTSKVGQWSVKNDIPVPEWSQFETDRNSARIEFNGRLNRFVENTGNASVKTLRKVLTNERFTQWTDLWGTLQVISEEVDTSATRAEVYYFSDMFESMPGQKRRNFDRVPPSSKTEAEKWAAQDAKALRNLIKVRLPVLKEIHVRVLPGGLATKDHADAVKYYWERLFRELGVPEVSYN
mgnify:CR=1 FL=1